MRLVDEIAIQLQELCNIKFVIINLLNGFKSRLSYNDKVLCSIDGCHSEHDIFYDDWYYIEDQGWPICFTIKINGEMLEIYNHCRIPSYFSLSGLLADPNIFETIARRIDKEYCTKRQSLE